MGISNKVAGYLSRMNSTAKMAGLGTLIKNLQAGTGLDSSSVTAAKIAAGAVVEAKIGAGAVVEAKIGADAVTNSKLADNAVSIENLDSGCKPTLICLAVEDALTTNRNSHQHLVVTGCAALANELKVDFNAHLASVAAHTTLADAVNVITTIDAGTADLASVIALTTELLTDYDAHEGDSELGSTWLYHAAQEAGDVSLDSTAAPTDLVECIARLNDLKAKFNAHEADVTAHGADPETYQVTTPDRALNAYIEVAVSGCVSGDSIFWSILNDGTGSVTGISAEVVNAGHIRFTFSAEPQLDTIISYSIFRTAA